MDKTKLRSMWTVGVLPASGLKQYYLQTPVGCYTISELRDGKFAYHSNKFLSNTSIAFTLSDAKSKCEREVIDTLCEIKSFMVQIK